MSTDARVVGGRRFRLRLIAAVAVLALAAGTAAVIGSGQGPRLSSLAYSATDLVTQSGQRVILYANQAVQPVRPRDVSVSPAASYSVTTSGNAIAVQFAGPLQYRRSYTVTIRGVRAPGQAVESTLVGRLTTGSTSIVSLVRGSAGGPDRLIERQLSGATNTVLYSAPKIRDFARIGRDLAILRDDPAGGSAIDLAEPGTDRVEHLTLPSLGGTATQLHAADDASGFGFVFRARGSPEQGLYLVSLAGTHIPLPVATDGRIATRSDDRPGAVTNWGFAPTTATALVATSAGRLVAVDSAGYAKPRSLGAADALRGFDPSGRTAVVLSAGRLDGVTIATDRRTPLPTSLSTVGPFAAASATAFVQVVGSQVVRTTASGTSSKLAVVLPTDGSVAEVCPSPNGQLAAIVTRAPDGDTVLVVDTLSGALAASVAGSTLDWCGAVPG